ncbi:MAG: Alpha-N-arabinofuranosidase, partial [Bryobacterales bacterium]|nr:Alpha-N-arabinofuranosidase [Bryobacterales bacterium]
EVFATQKLQLAAAGWRRYEFSLELQRSALAPREAADFVVATRDETRVLIDQIFLFPADNLEGMNPEMIEMARAMRSPIVRFGGNFTSVTTSATAWDRWTSGSAC